MKYSLVEIRLRVRFPSQILQAGRTLQCRQMMQNRDQCRWDILDQTSDKEPEFDCDFICPCQWKEEIK